METRPLVSLPSPFSLFQSAPSVSLSPFPPSQDEGQAGGTVFYLPLSLLSPGSIFDVYSPLLPPLRTNAAYIHNKSSQARSRLFQPFFASFFSLPPPPLCTDKNEMHPFFFPFPSVWTDPCFFPCLQKIRLSFLPPSLSSPLSVQCLFLFITIPTHIKELWDFPSPPSSLFSSTRTRSSPIFPLPRYAGKRGVFPPPRRSPFFLFPIKPKDGRYHGRTDVPFPFPPPRSCIGFFFSNGRSRARS